MNLRRDLIGILPGEAHPWVRSAVVGLLFGTIVLAVAFAPIMAWQSRRFGRLTLRRTVATAAFSVYCVTVLVYTMLPLPGPGWCALHGGRAVQMRPFHSLDVIAETARGRSLADLLLAPQFLEVALNVVLFVPWGAFVRRLLGWSPLAAVASGAALSILIETTQGTGLWGLVGCAYRFADVDDVLTNTLGSAIGAIFAPLVLRWLPLSNADIATRREARPVGRLRRLAGMLIDAAGFFLCWIVLAATAQLAAAGVLENQLDDAPRTWLTARGPGFGAVFVWFVVPLAFGNGGSWGQRAVWLGPARRPGPVARAARFASGIGGFAVLDVGASLPALDGSTASQVLGNAALVLAAVSLVVLVADRSARGLSYRVAGLGIADSRAETQPEPQEDVARP